MTDMALGFGWSIYFMLGMMTAMVGFIVWLIVKHGKTK